MAAYDPHELVTCPYNPAHQVEHYRMHIHLQKCHNTPGCDKKVTCPFDATHIVDETQLDHHVTTCPKRHLLDTQIYIVDDGCRPPVEPVPPPPPITAEESWEDDNVQSYRPDQSRLGNHVIKKPKGMTKSERRKFRMEGIKQFQPKAE